MQNLEYLGLYLLEHQLQERRRSFADVRRDRAVRGVSGSRRSARLIAREIRESRRHGR